MLLDPFRKEVGFKNIQGCDDIKDIVRRALDAEDNYNVLFAGPPASAKTLFLLGILECKKRGYFDVSNTTSRMLEVLEEERPKIICIDELDKMSRKFQNQLLNFMESGRVKVDQMKRRYDFEIKGAKVFATSNDISRLSKTVTVTVQKAIFAKIYRGAVLGYIGESITQNEEHNCTIYLHTGLEATW
jgi:hypothetical protein